MDSANLLKEVKAKSPKTRKHKPADPKTDMRRKENREPSEKQLAARFQIGNKGNDAPRTMRNMQKSYREGMATLAASVIPEMAVHALYNTFENPDYDISNFMTIAKFITEQAFGRSRVWTDYEQEQPSVNNVPTINIMNVNSDYVREQQKIDQQITFEGDYSVADEDDSLGDDDDDV